MKNLAIMVIVLSSVSCRNSQEHPGNLAAENLAALEQTVDMESPKIEQDDVLKFGQPIIELGTIPLGETREATLTATNRSDKPLVLLDVYTSCHCTKVSWDKKPIPSQGNTIFKIQFTAEQVGTFFKKIAVKHSAEVTPVTFAIQGVVADSSGASR